MALCQQLLGAPLHHGPSAGGPAERAKFHDWYGRTLDSYRAWFGVAPPADLWPAPHARFAGDYRRVDLRRCWVLIKPRLLFDDVLSAGVTRRLLLGALLLIGVPGCATLHGLPTTSRIWLGANGAWAPHSWRDSSRRDS